MENCGQPGRELFEGDGWYFRAREDRIRELIRDVRGRVLDVGCGAGMVGRLLPGREVWGVDTDPGALVLAARHINVRRCPAGALDFPDAWFDTATCFDVLEHTENDGEALGEINRVLKPSGLLYITVPLHSGLWSEHDAACGHFRRYDNIEGLLARKGFIVRSSTRFMALPCLLAPLVKRRKADLPPFNRILCKWIKLEEHMRAFFDLPGLTGVYTAVKAGGPA